MRDSDESLTYEAAGGVVVSETGEQVLLLIRPSRDEVRLPKGHIQPDETPVTAALREVQEETGYGDLEVLADLGSQLVTFLLDGAIILRTERYFLMQVRSDVRVDQPAPDTNQFYTVWVPWSEVADHLTFEAEREWARRACRTWEGRT
jgi:8-oxo-dGTP pyrophosphatase MutT (NUDIX family)